MKKYHRVAPEVKEQILKRIKEEGVTVEAAARLPFEPVRRIEAVIQGLDAQEQN